MAPRVRSFVSRRPLSTAASSPPPPSEPGAAGTILAGPIAYSKALSLFHWLVGFTMIGSVGAVSRMPFLLSFRV